jgi:cysteine synthase A
MLTTSESFDDVTCAAGATPLLRLGPVEPEGGARIDAKLEHLNPGGSAADRLVALLDRARAQGRLLPGGTVIEATLGNGALGLAPACALRGYRLWVCMPESMSLEKRAALRAWGVRLESTPAAEHLSGARARARELAGEAPPGTVLLLPQWGPGATAAVHREGLGAELVAQARAEGAKVDAFVAGIGTGGTLVGAGGALREAFAGVALHAVLPAADGPHRLQGLGTRTDALAFTAAHPEVQGTVDVGDAEAWAMCERLAKTMGLLVGPTSGAAVVAAVAVARALPPDARVVTVVWDTGERYFSMAGRGG